MNKYQTEQRQKLTQLFACSGHRSLSAGDVLQALGEQEISLSAIYRNLKEMEKEGIICKVAQKGHAEALYHYVDPQSCYGIIHLKCDSCEEIYHLNRHVSAMILGMAHEEFGFVPNQTGAFLYGKCKNCSQVLP